jgi:hypothetical protein
MRHTIYTVRVAIATALLLGSIGAATSAQAPGEAYTATASLKTRAGVAATAPVVVFISRLSTEPERATVIAALKKGGTPAVVQALSSIGDIGYIDVGERRTPLKYAHARPMSGGRLLTVVTSTPIAFLGAGLPDAKVKAGFDLALAILDVKDAGAGSGELVPAATVRLDAAGAIQVHDYGAEAVRLTNVQRRR